MNGEKETSTEKSTSLSCLPQSFVAGIRLYLNNPIDMQVSEQVGGSQLSLWYVFRKQNVRDDGRDGEQSDSIIIPALFWNTTLIAEILQMHLSVKIRIRKAA